MKGAAQRWVVAGLAGIALMLRAGGACAADVTDNDRLFRNFTRETATVSDGQVRLEIQGMKEQDDGNARLNVTGLRLRNVFPGHTPDTVSAGVINLVGAYGVTKTIEAGMVIPALSESVRFTDRSTVNSADIGDLLLYTKFRRPVAEHCDIGGGVEITMPNGPEHNGLGTGEFGVNPVVSTRYQRGPYSMGINAGYQIYQGDAVDVFNYGADVIVRGGESYALRTEIAGRVFSTGGKRFSDLTVLPGVDFNLTHNVLFRPTGMAGATGSALDWGVGAGMAVMF